ncbi:MAG TPA: hypothetical protein VN420_02905 [Candidatus Fimivivens sp.]|nr:hypothetical protein [Candidatus Fimivivens sp.]
MGDNTLSRTAYTSIHAKATQGGTRSATRDAEEQFHWGGGMDPLVDPKGPAHLGPVRLSLPRFEKQGNYWLLTRGIPMPEETLLDTTGSMGSNVDTALKVLMHDYEMSTGGDRPVLGRYDLQIATATFNDVEDNVRDGKPVLCRTQFEADEKIALQMALLLPGRGGYGNGKEDPQFGLFGAAYLTNASINRYGLKSYHFAVSDEPLVETVSLTWLKAIYGDDVLERIRGNGYDVDAKAMPDTAQVIRDLHEKAHAFFLQVDDRKDVADQWTDLYGADHVISLPDGTRHLHFVKAVVIGLTEGTLDLHSAKEFLRGHGASADIANKVIRATAHIPLEAQKRNEYFDRIPKAGDLFKEKTDLWPIDAREIDAGAEDVAASDDEPITWI